jgi:predicted acyl esterase
MFDATLIDEPDTHAYSVCEHYLVSMRDGVRLATDVYRPSHGSDVPDENPSGWPVVLHRTPYCKVVLLGRHQGLTCPIFFFSFLSRDRQHGLGAPAWGVLHTSRACSQEE